MMAMWKLYGYGDWKCSPNAVITLHYRCVQEDSQVGHYNKLALCAFSMCLSENSRRTNR